MHNILHFFISLFFFAISLLPRLTKFSQSIFKKIGQGSILNHGSLSPPNLRKENQNLLPLDKSFPPLAVAVCLSSSGNRRGPPNQPISSQEKPRPKLYALFSPQPCACPPLCWEWRRKGTTPSTGFVPPFPENLALTILSWLPHRSVTNIPLFRPT